MSWGKHFISISSMSVGFGDGIALWNGDLDVFLGLEVIIHADAPFPGFLIADPSQ